MYGEYSRYRVIDAPLTGAGPYEATVISHLDPLSMGTLLVELMKYNSSNGTPERSGQLITVRYLSPFYGVTPFSGLKPEDNYRSTQQSYGMWMVPPDQGTKVLVIYAEGNPAYAYWIGCIPDTGMNFMTPDPRASTTRTTSTVPENLQGSKLPVGEYNKTLVTGEEVDPTLYPKPYNNDFTQVLEVQGLIYDETRGTTTSSSRRETPSMVFGVSTPGPKDKRQGSPTAKYGAKNEKVDIPFSRLGGSSIVMDDGDERFVRATHAADGPPLYVNKELGESGGDETIPQNEGIRIRTRTGHQILMSNSEDLIYISNSRGTAWIELTSDGKIDVFGNDSISVHSNNDLNFSADRDVNIEGGRNVNIKASARFSQGLAYKDGKQSGRLHLEAEHDLNLRSGPESTFLNIEDGNFKIRVDGEIRLETKTDINFLAGQNIYETSEGSIHQKAKRNFIRQAAFDMIDDSTDYYVQVGNNHNHIVGNNLNQGVGANKNITIKSNRNEIIYANTNQHTFGNKYTLADGNIYHEAGASINNTAGTNMYNDIAGNFNIQAGAFFSADAANIHLNSGVSNPGVPASAGIAAPIDADSGFSGNSPADALGVDDNGKLVTITLPYTIPGEKFPVEIDTIVPRMPMHEPWTHHENMNPQAFKPEETDRDEPGELPSVDRVLTPDTFLKNRTGLQSSIIVPGTGGGIGGYSGEGWTAGGSSNPAPFGDLPVDPKTITSYGVPPAGPPSKACTHPRDVSQYLAPITTSIRGLSCQVAAVFQKPFQDFIDELEAGGYEIKNIGGYCYRQTVSGKRFSYHASGVAIDINVPNPVIGGIPNGYFTTPQDPAKVSDMPLELTRRLCAKYGLGWGGDWTSCSDAMHFSFAKSERGAYDIKAGYIPIDGPDTPKSDEIDTKDDETVEKTEKDNE